MNKWHCVVHVTIICTQVFIKDTNTVNTYGTFVNGDQLGPSREKRELRTDDVVEFGVNLKSKGYVLSCD